MTWMAAMMEDRVLHLSVQTSKIEQEHLFKGVAAITVDCHQWQDNKMNRTKIRCLYWNITATWTIIWIAKSNQVLYRAKATMNKKQLIPILYQWWTAVDWKSSLPNIQLTPAILSSKDASSCLLVRISIKAQHFLLIWHFKRLMTHLAQRTPSLK